MLKYVGWSILVRRWRKYLYSVHKLQYRSILVLNFLAKKIIPMIAQCLYYELLMQDCCHCVSEMAPYWAQSCFHNSKRNCFGRKTICVLPRGKFSIINFRLYSQDCHMTLKKSLLPFELTQPVSNVSNNVSYNSFNSLACIRALSEARH